MMTKEDWVFVLTTEMEDIDVKRDLKFQKKRLRECLKKSIED
jgi:hypothetical protein